MRFTKRVVWTAIGTILVFGLVAILGLGIGIVKLWPVARTWALSTAGAGSIDAARRAVAQVGAQLGDERIVQLSRAGEGMAGLAALMQNPEMARVLKWTSAMPALVPLLQNGSYQKAMEEAVRQNVSSISQVQLDRVTSPEVRGLLAEVQRTLAANPPDAEAAAAVNTNVLNLLKSEAFGRLSRSPEFSRLLSGPEAAGKPE